MQTTNEVPESDQAATAPDHGADAPDSTMAEAHMGDMPERDEKSEKHDLQVIVLVRVGFFCPCIVAISLSLFHSFVDIPRLGVPVAIVILRLD